MQIKMWRFHLKCARGYVGATAAPGGPGRCENDCVKEWTSRRSCRTESSVCGREDCSGRSERCSAIGGPSAAIAVEELATRCGHVCAGRHMRRHQSDVRGGDVVIRHRAVVGGTSREYAPIEYPRRRF